MATDHYIPQFLLKRFTTPTGGLSLTVWDKVDNRIFYPNVKDFGIENFHTFTDNEPWRPGGETESIEEILNLAFEEPAAPILDRVIRTNTLHLTEQERSIIIAFIALQSLRIPGHFRTIETFFAEDGEAIPRSLRVTGTPEKPGFMRNPKIGSIVADAIGLLPVLSTAHMALIYVGEGVLVIGDDPVVTQSPPNYPTSVKPVFKVSPPDHDVFLPISPRHVLYLYTQSNVQVGTIGKTLQAPHQVKSDAAGFLNKLQAQNAVRYVVLNSGAQRSELFSSAEIAETNFFTFRELFEKQT